MSKVNELKICWLKENVYIGKTRNYLNIRAPLLTIQITPTSKKGRKMMGFFEKYEIEIIKIKNFLEDTRIETITIIDNLNEKFKFKDYIKSHPRQLFFVIILLLVVMLNPLLSVWILACVGTGYPGYKIIRSILNDNKKNAENDRINQEIRKYIHNAIATRKIIQIPVKHNSMIVHRSIIVCGEMEDGISIEDPGTKIRSKCLWDNIDLGSLYITYVKESEV